MHKMRPREDFDVYFKDKLLYTLTNTAGIYKCDSHLTPG